MKQPSDREIRALRKKYNELIAQAQAKCIRNFQEVRDYIYSQLSELKTDSELYPVLEAYIIGRYNEMFLGLKTDIIDNYNQAGIIETDFAENTMNERLRFEPALVAVLPDTKPFKITNRILTEKSILKRSRIMADQVTQAIADSFANGSSIQAVQKKIDIIMGFRNARGQITQKAKDLIIQGKFSHRNGHIYQTYRIARTETMRMASIRTFEIFEGVEREDKRLKLISVIDSRTRWQSALMNGQISDKNGRFKYPDGVYYKLGEQPKQWSINDRETQVVVFLDNEETAQELKAQEKANSINIDLKQNNILPKLDNNALDILKSPNKDVLLKVNIIKRNKERHPDLTESDNNIILGSLYKYNQILQDKKKTNYFHFIQRFGEINYVVLLDNTQTKNNFEVVHYHKINNKNLEKLINKNK